MLVAAAGRCSRPPRGIAGYQLASSPPSPTPASRSARSSRSARRPRWPASRATVDGTALTAPLGGVHRAGDRGRAAARPQRRRRGGLGARRRLALGAGASYATYTVGSKRLLDDGHAPEAVMAGGFGLAAIAAAAGARRQGRQVASVDGLALALYLGAIPTALAYVLFARGLRRLTAGETATLTLAEPLTAACSARSCSPSGPGRWRSSAPCSSSRAWPRWRCPAASAARARAGRGGAA